MRQHRTLILMIVAPLALGLVVFTHRTLAGSRDQEGEHEAIVYHGITACGVERWSVKTGTDSDARSVNQKAIVPTTIFRLRSLPAPSSPPVFSRLRPTETTEYQVTATLLRYKLEADSDVHLVIADSGGRTMIAEIPAPQCVGSSSPFLPTSINGTFHETANSQGSITCATSPIPWKAGEGWGAFTQVVSSL
jgi:hypothetical protein